MQAHVHVRLSEHILKCWDHGDDIAWRKGGHTFFELTDNLQRGGIKVIHSGSSTANVDLWCNK